MKKTKNVEASIYIGSVHNWVDIEQLTLKEVSPKNYKIMCSGLIDFEYEGVAKNESFEFQTTAFFKGKV